MGDGYQVQTFINLQHRYKDNGFLIKIIEDRFNVINNKSNLSMGIFDTVEQLMYYIYGYEEGKGSHNSSCVIKKGD